MQRTKTQVVEGAEGRGENPHLARAFGTQQTRLETAVGHTRACPSDRLAREYQHSTGDSVEDSIRGGFDQWAQTDLVTLLDALLPRPKTCTTLEMTFPGKDSRPAKLSARRSRAGHTL